MRHRLLAILVLVLAAVAFRPLENRIHAERVQMKYGGARVSLTVREKLGQGMWVALLAGFRGVAADFLWIQNQSYFEKQEWAPMYWNFELVSMLQPQSTMFWDYASWHMGFNIAYSVSKDPKNVNKAQGIRREREWHQRARDFLLRGIENVPNQWNLYFCLAFLYQHKFTKDCGNDAECERAAHGKAAEYFRKAAEFPDAPIYIGRECAIELEKSGRAMDAYEYWKTLWRMDRKTPHQEWNVIARFIIRLEDELAIPATERVPRKPDGSLRDPS